MSGTQLSASQRNGLQVNLSLWKLEKIFSCMYSVPVTSTHMHCIILVHVHIMFFNPLALPLKRLAMCYQLH